MGCRGRGSAHGLEVSHKLPAPTALSGTSRQNLPSLQLLKACTACAALLLPNVTHAMPTTLHLLLERSSPTTPQHMHVLRKR